MSQRSARRSMDRAKGKQKADARFFFLSMQAKGFWSRFALAHRLVWRVDLRRQAKREGVNLRDLRKRGLVE